MDHLDELESGSIYVLREGYHNFSHLCMPWSMGKDSNVLLWLSKKAFCGKIPFPVLHIDTTYEFPEMLEFREWARTYYELNLIVKINEDARYGRGDYSESIGYETHDPVTVTHELKTVALRQILAQHHYDALITGIRRDEDPTRAKERYFSPRTADGEWDYKDQPPEFWDQFTVDLHPGEHMRIQPLLDWGEVDIWRYIEREKIPIPRLYFAKLHADGRFYRYRSLGCWPVTQPIESSATTVPEIIEELLITKTSERGGRAQDHCERNAMQKLRAKGFL
ncbi:MAG: sulfate adenylyltransferase [Verrucomicrobia bacterium]|nr:MAG: sulfate adenylyltransferase [Verrucomicrobiota bacterium]